MNQINNPQNNSTSKAQWSFPRSSRRSMAKKLYCDMFYDIPSTRTQRKTSMGFGKKVDITQNKIFAVPPPNLYSPQDFIQQNKKANKGFTPGFGRQETKNQSFIKFDPQIPGPGNYDIRIKNQAPKYTMRPRTISDTFINSNQKIIPGPGKYNKVDDINPEGNYYLSKWSSSKSKRFDPNNSLRFPQKKNQIPGPGKYYDAHKNFLNSSLCESKYTSNGNRRFATGQRKTIFQDQSKKKDFMPGPGNYSTFSDFGQIKSIQKLKSNKKVRPQSSRYYH